MEEKTRPYRMEANAGVDLEVETENEGTEIGITAQGKWDIPSGAFSARIILYLCQKGHSWHSSCFEHAGNQLSFRGA
jgi:hypothetical protein